MKTKIIRTVMAMGAIVAMVSLYGCGAGSDDGTPEPAVTFEEVKALVSSDLEDMDEFGSSVAIGGDTVAVGARCEDGAGTERGAVYIYDRNEGGTDAWGEVKKISAGDGQDGDWFGQSLALAGDCLAVGAANPNSGTSDRGGVYIFHRNEGGAGNWGQVTRITGGDTTAGDLFGMAVALDGECLIVGAPGEDAAGYRAGAAYVFYRSQGGPDAWGQVAKIIAPDGHALEYFGVSADVSGERAVVGAIGLDLNDTGSACVFSRNQGGPDAWGEVKKITAGDPQPEDQFGMGVAVLGDTIVVGAGCEDGPTGSVGDNPGAAYIYSKDQGGADHWGQVKKLTKGTGTGAFFGVSVGLASDYLVVGALYNTGPGTGQDRGGLYFYSRNAGGDNNWGLLKNTTASDGEDMDFLGNATGFDGDYAVAGAPNKWGGGVRRGAAYIFKRTTR